MTIRVPRRSTIALAAAGAVASTGTAYLGARNLLVGQATQARTIIPKSWDVPPRADGVYTPGGGPVQRWQRGVTFDLHLMIFGDSTATGYGCEQRRGSAGVLLARGLAEHTGKRIRLSTKAIVGATSKGVCSQVDAMFVAGPPPDAAVMMLGANDITALNGISQSAHRLALAVRKLRARGAVVVVGTCPDLGVITAIPQPLRSLAQHSVACASPVPRPPRCSAAGGVPVPLAHLLAPQFRTRPEHDVLRRPVPSLGGRRTRWPPSSCCPVVARRWAKRCRAHRFPRRHRPARRCLIRATRAPSVLSRLWRSAPATRCCPRPSSPRPCHRG